MFCSVFSCCIEWFRRSMRPAVLVVLLILLLGPMQAVMGQNFDPQVRQQAIEAFHGPDLEGKDGPFAKAGFDLTLLYYEWKAAQRQGATADFAPSPSLPVQSGHVVIDATAARDPLALRDSLVALGLTNGAQAGSVVSGRLPIAAIPEAMRLATLRAMRPARAQTHGTGNRLGPGSTAVGEAASGENTPSSTAFSNGGWMWSGAVAAGVAGWLLLYRRWL